MSTHYSPTVPIGLSRLPQVRHHAFLVDRKYESKGFNWSPAATDTTPRTICQHRVTSPSMRTPPTSTNRPSCPRCGSTNTDFDGVDPHTAELFWCRDCQPYPYTWTKPTKRRTVVCVFVILTAAMLLGAVFTAIVEATDGWPRRVAVTLGVVFGAACVLVGGFINPITNWVVRPRKPSVQDH